MPNYTELHKRYVHFVVKTCRVVFYVKLFVLKCAEQGVLLLTEQRNDEKPSNGEKSKGLNNIKNREKKNKSNLQILCFVLFFHFFQFFISIISTQTSCNKEEMVY